MVVTPNIWFTGSPLTDAFHQYDLGVARRALEDPATPAQEETMSLPSPVSPVPSQPTAFDRLQHAYERLSTDLSDLERVVLDQAESIKELQAKLAELSEQGGRTRSRNDMNDQIVAYLRDSVPGVWMTPTAVGINLNVDAKSVSGRLERLSRIPSFGIERQGGRGSGAHPLYRIVPPQSES